MDEDNKQSLPSEEGKNLKDHREIGQEQELFFIDEEIGSGLPVWLPKGAVIRRELERYMTDLEIKEGYLHVTTSHLAKLDIFIKSGHWQHYKDGMFPSMKRGNEEYVLRPMNCPHHIQIFNHKPRSYRELPMRIAEFGTIYRWENSGELSGLIRVRNMTLNDAHIFCSQSQLKEEFKKAVKLVEKVYQDLHLKDFWYRLSLHDPNDKEKYVDDPKMWKTSEDAIREALEELGLDYKEGVGEAAFYGPKLDVQIPNVLGKDETVSTVQIDFHLPKQFDLQFNGPDGSKQPIVMVHRGIISTLERMVGFLIEQYQGAFPTWLSPVQVTLIPIADRHNEYANKLLREFREVGVRAEVDDRSEKMQSKIRDAQMQKVPYMVIVGDREQEEGKVSVRKRNGENVSDLDFGQFLDEIKKEIASKA